MGAIEKGRGVVLQEERIYFNSGDLKLEGLYADAGSDCGVVISHPNPLMGGSMHNNVVESLGFAFFRKGYSTLRFNFRGVGRSTGVHDKGEGEKEDLAGAIACMSGRGATNIALSGYSFGAWVTAGYLQNNLPTGPVVLVAPPVSVYPFSPEALLGKIDLIVFGDKDPFCRSEDILPFSQKIEAKPVLIFQTDHFFAGKENDLIENVQKYVLDSVF